MLIIVNSLQSIIRARIFIDAFIHDHQLTQFKIRLSLIIFIVSMAWYSYYNYFVKLKPKMMKNLAGLIMVLSVGVATAQSGSLKKERYERYENGELIEQDFSVEKDGVPQENYDFSNDEFFKQKSLSEMNADFDTKRADMDNRMKEMQQKADRMMNSRMSDMNSRMEEMQQRMSKMQQNRQKIMDDSEPKMKEQKSPSNLSPQPETKPASSDLTVQTFGA